MADRLFDIRFTKEAHFASLRHQFCKKFEPALWIFWAIVLTVTVFFSLSCLNSDKIFVGLALVLFILLYNLLNQYFSQEKFPKEVLVSILFTYGTLFFLEGPLEINNFIHFFLICFLNCLIISNKDKQVDKLMGVRSWAHTFSHRSICVVMSLSCIYYLITFKCISKYALKALPAPVRTKTLVSVSAAASINASHKSSIISELNAFSASGRFMVTTRTLPWLWLVTTLIFSPYSVSFLNPTAPALNGENCSK